MIIVNCPICPESFSVPEPASPPDPAFGQAIASAVGMPDWSTLVAVHAGLDAVRLERDLDRHLSTHGPAEWVPALMRARSHVLERTCRACGCTDDDCSQCIASAGAPCWWVEVDLCSSCAGADKSLVAG